MLSLLGGIFLGWSLGANDASNVIGPSVTSRMVTFWKAAAMASAFVLLGAILQGQAGIETLKGLTHLSLEKAVISSVCAAITVTIMTFLSLPVSTSQAIVGAILGMGLMSMQINLEGLLKVVICWLGTPLGALIISALLFKILGTLYNLAPLNLFQSDSLMRTLLILSGFYGAYSLGANNVANVTAVFVGAGRLNVLPAAILGGLSIGLGILTFSKRVMDTVGTRLVRLDAFAAFVVLLSEAITVHAYSLIGVPVSTSQAVIGAIMGIGLVKGIQTVDKKTLGGIFIGWSLTPVVACFLSLVVYFVMHLHYLPPG